MAPNKKQRRQPITETQPEQPEPEPEQPELEPEQPELEPEPETFADTCMAMIQDNQVIVDIDNNDDNEEELPHKSRVDKGKEPLEATPMNNEKYKEKDTSETTERNSTGFSIEKKLKSERLSYIITQAVEKELMKSEFKTKSSSTNRTVDYCRTTTALKGISELVDKQSYLNQELRRVESEMKKLLGEVSKDIMNTDVMDENLNWSHIVDISRRGRGISVHYSDGSRESIAKLNEYMNLKTVEMRKFPDKEMFIIDKEVMSKVLKEYLSRDEGGQIMENLDSIISAHKKNKGLFDEQFYDEYFQKEVIRL